MTVFTSKPIRLGIVLLLALLIVNGLLSYRAVRILRERRADVRQIYDSRQNLEQIFSLLKDAESGQRGYLYTGETTYLQPYIAAVPKIQVMLHNLDLDQNPNGTSPSEARLRTLISRKLDELAQTVELRKQGKPAEVRELVISGTGKQTMDAIRQAILAIEAEQQAHLDEATRRQQEADSYLVATLAFASGTAFMFVLLFAAALGREARRVKELQEAEKLATTGRMAATVAHEINNPLEAATNLIYLSSTAKDLPESIRNMLDLADRELARVAHMTKQTLGFYKSATSSEQVNIIDLLDEVVRLFDSKLQGKNLSVRKDYAVPCAIETNRGELFQVVTNIFSNAIDASYQSGTISIGCSGEQGGIAITVDDEGVGIPKDAQEKIFQAFVTTKKDVGTGLGLWVSERLVAKHGGRITVKSQAAGRKGSSFKVWLPGEIASKNGNAAASSAS